MPRRGGDLKPGKAGAQLGFAAQAGGADNGAVGQVFQPLVVVGHEGVEGAFALADGGQGKAFGQGHGHVFDGVHGEVGAAVGQGLFELFHKQAFAADFGEGFIEDAIALGGDAEDGYLAAGVEGAQAGLDMFGLPHGQGAFAAGDNESVRSHSGENGGCKWRAVYHETGGGFGFAWRWL